MAMGTSTSQRSPATPEWDRVRELYKQPNPLPGEVVGRIIEALSPETRQQMHSRSVIPSLDALLEGSFRVATQGLSALLDETSPLVQTPVIAIAATLRGQTQQYLTEARLASRFGELALDALSNSVMEVAAGPEGLLGVSAAEVETNLAQYTVQQNLAGLAGKFFTHDFDQVFRYFVARDIGDFVGTEAFPSVSHSSRLLDQVAHYCRESAAQVSMADWEDQLYQVVALPINERITRLEPVVAQGITTGLEVLAGGR